jgi:rRNA-processing protein FCF1
MAQKYVVLDTSVFYAVAAPYEIEEIRALAPAELVVPFSVLAELDQLMQRTRERDRARSALHVLNTLVSRGAAREPVSCGKDLTIRLASAQEEVGSVVIPGIDLDLADDRILSCAANIRSRGGDAVVATTEFALYAKSLGCGMAGLYLDRYAQTGVMATRRERAAFDLSWSRLLTAQDTWAVCRRASVFLRVPLVARLLASVRETQQPSNVYWIVSRFDALNAQWQGNVELKDILQGCLGLWHPAPADFSSKTIEEPAQYGINYVAATRRRETPDERALRIRSEEAANRSRDEFNVDSVLAWMELVREHVLGEIGEGE